MAFDMFGFEIKRKGKEPTSFAPKITDDGAVVVAEGGAYGTAVDMDGSVRTEAELVNKYREMSGHPEVDMAIEEICNEVIISEPETKLVELILDDIEELPEKTKNLFISEFDQVLDLLEFNQIAYEVFRRWYVDGRLYYHAIIDETNPQAGIVELRYIDPRKIRKIRTIQRKRLAQSVDSGKTEKEYYVYTAKGFAKTSGTNSVPGNSIGGIKIAKDSIIHCTSGLLSDNNDVVKSYLHKAIKPLNQLRSMEDSLVIYRISRAPERRIFYIDVGDLPKMKAEQYMRDIMVKFKNRLVYDANTGEIRDDRKFMTMLEDFWLPRREGRGTEISTLPGGQNLNQIEDIEYFLQKLYQSLNVPITRLSNESTPFSFGRGNEISRDEVKFAKFVTKLRNKFSILFMRVLERQLILKRIITPEDWDLIKNKIKFKFAQDNYYAELKETEVLRDRMAMLRDMNDYIGRFYSNEWVRRNVLKQSDEEMQEIDQQIEQEMGNPIYNPPMEQAPGQGGAPDGQQGGTPQQAAAQPKAPDPSENEN
jgi:hypothetical protein